MGGVVGVCTVVPVFVSLVKSKRYIKLEKTIIIHSYLYYVNGRL